MVTITEGDFNGMACLWLSNPHVRLAVTTARGPRVAFWGWRDGPNLFAELPDAAVETPAGPYYFLGGHRLWYAPESLDTTYWPDNHPLEVTHTGDEATFTTQADNAGIVKQITIHLSPDAPQVRLTHTLSNAGPASIHLALWAITMCRPGGVALLPQPQQPTDPQGFLPNRNFSYWPYTDILDNRLVQGNRVVLVKATPGPNNKIGYRSTHGWLAYLLDNTLFTKSFDPQLRGEHPDMGCNAEVFFSDNVIELETLAPLVTLDPGSETTHEETWALHNVTTPVEKEDDALALAGLLDLK